MISNRISYEGIIRNRNIIRYTLSAPATVSAGVFEQDGDTLRLVRTISGGEVKQAGTHTVYWDGTDDFDNELPDGDYKTKVLSNNINYEWQGIIGNTSTNTIGVQRHFWTDRIWDLIVVGSEAYFVVGYTEGSPSQWVINTATPNVPGEIWTDADDLHGGLLSRNLCSDGTNVYYACLDSELPNITCVFAIKVSDKTEVTFSSGETYDQTYGRVRTYNVIDKLDQVNAFITGIAVQQTGNYLFVARSAANSVHVLNKTTGALVQSLTVTTPRYMCVDGSDNLWIISGTNTVAKYTVNGDGTLSAATLTLSGLVYPVAVSVSPDGTTVAVADGSTSQQIKAFSNSTGASSWTYGQAGGYVNSPLVADDKLWFKSGKFLSGTDSEEVSFIAFQSDGSFWVGDSGNQRTMRINAARTAKLAEVMNMGFHYCTNADPNEPTRVFANYLEFEIDYALPLQLGNGSWTLVKNWVGNVDTAKDDNFNRLKYVTTLSNGRTYAFARVPGTKFEIIELTATGIRYTGVETTSLLSTLEKNGDIYYLTNTYIGQTTQWKKQALTGFDGSGNPQYGSLTTVASVLAATHDPVAELIYNGIKTDTDVLISLVPDITGEVGLGYHLGLIKAGDTEWLARTAKGTHDNYMGEYPDDGRYDIGNQVQYGAAFVTSIERSIFMEYHGEFWKNKQTNKWQHYYDNGLLLNVFGITGPEALAISLRAAPSMAGNVIHCTFVKVGDDYYLYHCDESYHGGTHRWKISGLNTIQENTINITKTGIPAAPALDYVNLMEGLPFDSIVPNNTAGWTKYPATEINSGGEQWNVQTSVHTYKKEEKDIWVRNWPGASGLTTWVKRDLGTNTGLTAWSIIGEMAYPMAGELGDNFIDVLDSADRVIVRISRPALSYPTMAIKANSTSIVEGNEITIHYVMRKLQPLSIEADGEDITVTIADYAPVTVSIYDALADITNPTTLRLQTYSADTSGHEIDIANLKFYTE